MQDLPIIQKTYDLIKWYVPILNRLPKQHKFMLGERMASNLYDLLEELIYARYATQKLERLEALNSKLDVIRHQTRLLLDFELIKIDRYQHAGELINTIGKDLGGWIKQQRKRSPRVNQGSLV
ncbi:MAG: diversity-generating retroelement protein Avd [Cyanobacteria bacterium P01_F01_bin.150]